MNIKQERKFVPAPIGESQYRKLKKILEENKIVINGAYGETDVKDNFPEYAEVIEEAKKVYSDYPWESPAVIISNGNPEDIKKIYLELLAAAPEPQPILETVSIEDLTDEERQQLEQEQRRWSGEKGAPRKEYVLTPLE